MLVLRNIALAATLLLGGCNFATFGDLFGGLFGSVSALDGGLSVTATVANPITPEQRAAVELSYFAAAEAAVTYARLPRCKPGQAIGPVPTCSSWPVVQKIRDINRKAYASIGAFRNFMDHNQQISAISAFNAAVQALRDFRAVAYVNNIPVPDPAQ